MAQESSTNDNKRKKRNFGESKSKMGRESAGKCLCIKSGALRVLVPGIADASTQLEAVAVGVV